MHHVITHIQVAVENEEDILGDFLDIEGLLIAHHVTV